MTPAEQQRAIAGVMGKGVLCSETLEAHEFGEWRAQEKPRWFRYRCCAKCPALHIEGERSPTWDSDKVAPDYLNDLNAMYEAEEMGGPTLVKAMRFWLYRLCDEMTAHHASAAQHAEAYLKAKGLWKE